ncbi:hypothetical protein QBC38DRAFT_466258 [Podospora fimiseda]|uniref:Uncharacterized protein n=1 Tax=Podospora fimiseda TaxID=252190 RepID=A0AAN7BX39_9PEZI|nr:hypothetical protein QBC38DRAFT_466258 [Podospora fimiseda]
MCVSVSRIGSFSLLLESFVACVCIFLSQKVIRFQNYRLFVRTYVMSRCLLVCSQKKKARLKREKVIEGAYVGASLRNNQPWLQAKTCSEQGFFWGAWNLETGAPYNKMRNDAWAGPDPPFPPSPLQ